MVDSVGAFLASLDAGVFPLASWGWLPAGEVLGSSVGRSAWPPEPLSLRVFSFALGQRRYSPFCWYLRPAAPSGKYDALWCDALSLLLRRLTHALAPPICRRRAVRLPGLPVCPIGGCGFTVVSSSKGLSIVSHWWTDSAAFAPGV